MAEQRKYRKFTASQKLEIVLAGLRGDRSVRDVCREHEIAETLYYAWRDKILEGGKAALAGKDERQGEREIRSASASWSAPWVARPMSSRWRGKHCGVGVRERVARSRQLVAAGRKVAVVARVMQVSRQAIYRTPRPRTRPGPRPATGTVDRAIVEVAKPTRPTAPAWSPPSPAARSVGRSRASAPSG